MQIRFLAMALCALLVYGNDARADGNYTVDQPLSFGTFALLDNDAEHTIIIEPDNDVNYDPEIIPGPVQAERAEITLTDLPPNMVFTVGVMISNGTNSGGVTFEDDPTMSLGGGGGGQLFTINDFTVNDETTFTTDGSGNAPLYIGATLRTSGTGTQYADGAYSGNYDLTLFFEP